MKSNFHSKSLNVYWRHNTLDKKKSKKSYKNQLDFKFEIEKHLKAQFNSFKRKVKVLKNYGEIKSTPICSFHDANSSDFERF